MNMYLSSITHNKYPLIISSIDRTFFYDNNHNIGSNSRKNIQHIITLIQSIGAYNIQISDILILCKYDKSTLNIIISHLYEHNNT
jgi:hypothetical protein